MHTNTGKSKEKNVRVLHIVLGELKNPFRLFVRQGCRAYAVNSRWYAVKKQK